MKVSVLLATYNNEKYIGELLSSLLNQTYGDFTCYIHDDGSADGTMDIVEDFSDRYPGRFVIVGDPPGTSAGTHFGAKGNFFYLLSEVDSDIYLFADGDDVWMKDKIKKSVTSLMALGQQDIPLLVFCDMKVTDEALRVTGDSFVRTIGRDMHYTDYREIVMDNPAAGCAMCFNRACRDAAILKQGDEDFREVTDSVEMHDVWLLITAALLGRVGVIEEPLVYYRQHGDNEMGAKSENFLQKIGRNLSGLLSGDILQKKRAYYDNARALAEAASKLPGISGEDRDILQRFCSIREYSKLKRILFLKNNGFRRKRHSLWIWLWV